MEDLRDAMTSANDFSFTSRLTSGFSFDEEQYHVLTGYFSPCANLPRSGAQQNLRIRKIILKSGFYSIANNYNTKVMSRPLGYKQNKELCLAREDFSLNLLDDWGSSVKTLRVHTPEAIRPLYYHIRNEQALSGRPKLFKKIFSRWNSDSGFLVKSYEEFERAVPVTRYLQSIVGKYATNVIVSMSGSLPPYFSPLKPMVDYANDERPKIGLRPEYLEIQSININRYTYLSTIPDAARTSEDYWEMQRYEYDQLFQALNESEKTEHWVIFRDSKKKVLNDEREFKSLVSKIESFANYKWTIRSGGQDLRARQLSEIRLICKHLRIKTLHSSNMKKVSDIDLQKAKDYVWENRDAISKIFEINFQVDNKGNAYPWLNRRIISQISKDPQL